MPSPPPPRRYSRAGPIRDFGVLAEMPQDVHPAPLQRRRRTSRSGVSLSIPRRVSALRSRPRHRPRPHRRQCRTHLRRPTMRNVVQQAGARRTRCTGQRACVQGGVPLRCHTGRRRGISSSEVSGVLRESMFQVAHRYTCSKAMSVLRGAHRMRQGRQVQLVRTPVILLCVRH